MFTISAGRGKKLCCVLAEMLSTFAGCIWLEKMIMRIISWSNYAMKMS